MSWFSDNFLYESPGSQRRNAANTAANLQDWRDTLFKRQDDLLNTIAGNSPKLTPQMEARLQALEEESKPGPLVSDPLFQGDRAQLIQGGQQALSGIQNVQRAANTSGGFSNQGSMNDIYDRLGMQLAQLGQQSRAVKEQKRDVAASARQQLYDAQVAHANAVNEAKMALLEGDYARYVALVGQAQQAQQSINAAQQAMFGSILSTGGAIAGGLMGGRSAGGVGLGGTGLNIQIPLSSQLQMPQLGASYYNLPYAAMRQ